ncbi:terpene synthase family protein [Streptomyces sp. NPDC050625]|uniref:terpene synthase family protein n=1 Tax=Streptomyces sp. NPDC050625 TaxID=3154629 RepID=UPI0034272FE4
MESNALNWMQDLELARDAEQERRVRAIGCGELGARTVEAHAPTALTQISVDSLLWLFIFDDTYCDEGTHSADPAAMSLLVARLLRIAETGTSPAVMTAHEKAFLDLRRRIAATASPTQLMRWIDALRSYLAYQAWEAAHRARGTRPETDAYLTARIANGSMPVCCAVLDITSGFEVPAQEMNRTDVRALTEMCCALVGLDNDIMSHWKETLRCGDGINLIDVLAADNACTPEEALPMAIAIRDRILTRYLQLRETTEGRLGAEGERYLKLLDQWIRGNLDWGLGSGRYRNPDNPAVLPDHVTACAPRPSAGPLPYAGTAWWWAV